MSKILFAGAVLAAAMSMSAFATENTGTTPSADMQSNATKAQDNATAIQKDATKLQKDATKSQKDATATKKDEEKKGM